MEPMGIAKQMIDFQKAAFNNSYHAMVMLQEQTEKMADTFFGETVWIPEEGKKVYTEWVKAYKKGRDDFKKAVDQNYKNIEDFWAVSGK